jgi:hypothetical protein
MASTIRQSPRSRQAQTLDLPLEPEDKLLVPDEATELALFRECFRAAIELSREKKEVVAIALRLPDASYLSKLFNGEKTLTSRHIVGLPEHVERIFAKLYAQAKGLMVVEPVHGEDAVRSLVAGLVGVLAPSPCADSTATKRRMAKAGVRVIRKSEVA